MPDDATAALDIVLACRRVLRFTEGVEEPAFLADEEKHWAAASQLLLIGEAVKRLSDRFQEEHSHIPWAQMAAVRNRLIHQYDRINWHLVWKTATEDIPRLLSELQSAVPTEPPQEAARDGD